MSIVAIVQAISDSVVAGLAAAGQLPLTPLPDGSAGKILLGDQHQYENTDAPRVIFTPVSSKFGAPDPANHTLSDARHPNATDRIIGSEIITFEVRCWGRGVVDASGGTSPDDDYEATQALYRQVFASVNELTLGVYELGDGEWANTVQHVRRGREMVFTVSVATPVYVRLPLATTTSPVPAPVNPPSNYVPPGTSIVPGNGQPGLTVTLT